MQRLNLVDESHKALGELSAMRTSFQKGVTDIETAKQAIGLFNATSRSIGIAINAEKWYQSKQKHQVKSK